MSEKRIHKKINGKEYKYYSMFYPIGNRRFIIGEREYSKIRIQIQH